MPRGAGSTREISDTRYIHKSGRIVWLSWMGAWSEPVSRHFFIGRDMTESRVAQEALRESEQLGRGIVDTALDAFVQMKEMAPSRTGTRRPRQMFGWPRDEALGRHLEDLIVPESSVTRTAGLARFCAGHPRSSDAVSKSRRCGAMARKSRSSSVSPGCGAASGIVFNGFIRDLTDKIAAQDRIPASRKNGGGRPAHRRRRA